MLFGVAKATPSASKALPLVGRMF